MVLTVNLLESLKKILQQQKAQGSDISEYINLSSERYEWSADGKLTTIHFESDINGKVSVEGFENLEGIGCSNVKVTEL